jgi:hypothetical protein
MGYSLKQNSWLSAASGDSPFTWLPKGMLICPHEKNGPFSMGKSNNSNMKIVIQ